MSQAAEANRPTALLVIDVQEGNVRPEGWPQYWVANQDGLLANVQSLIAKARGAGSEVIYIQHAESDWPEMAPGAPQFEVVPEIAPDPDDKRFTKWYSDSFVETGLGEYLDERGHRHIVTAGVASNFCIDSTTRSAVFKGYNVTLATDAHSTSGNSALTAEQIIAGENAVLPNLAGPGGATVSGKPTDEIEFAPAEGANA
jgi:nicotinamidase-related amidase